MNDTTRRFALTVGPVQYLWPRATLLAFYAEMAESPADTLVLGETVCARRREMRFDDWLALARDLTSAGKEVVFATQTLIETEADLRQLERLAAQDEFVIEANDASALHLLAGRGGFDLGAHLNVYSRAALIEHAGLGARRWVAPAELPLDAIGLMNPPEAPVTGHAGAPMAGEVLAFGRLPLAFSARCFTARHHRLRKDACEYRCLAHPDGLLLASSEGRPFLTLNGTQTQSAAQHCLVGERDALVAAGVPRLRLLPCSSGFAEVLRHFDAVMNQGADADEALAALTATALPGGLANGFAHRRAGLDWSHA